MNSYTYVRNNPLRFIDPNGLDIITYDQQGNEIKRVNESKWHNFWCGDTYEIDTDDGLYSIAEPLTTLKGDERYIVVGALETGTLVDDFVAEQGPPSLGQSLSLREIAHRAVGDWNWKVTLNRNYGAHALFMLEGLGQRSDYLGNYAFGYLMNAWDPWGPNTWLARWGGAAFNLYESFKSPTNDPFKGSLRTGYDDPRDFAAINAGAAYFWRTR